MSSYYEKFADGKVVCIDEEIPFELPQGWEWCRLSCITSILGDGIHGTPEYDNAGDIYFVNGNNLNDGIITIKDDTKRVNSTEAAKHKRTLTESTVLVSINGTIGKVAFYNNEKIILGKSACYFNLLGCINKVYVKCIIETEYFSEYAKKVATGTTIKNVPLAGMRNFLIPLPSLSEQSRIVHRINDLKTKVSRYNHLQSELDILNHSIFDKLKKSALQEGVQGRLVPQIAEEGTAKELLEQIKKEKQKLVKEGKLKKSALATSVIFRGDDNKYFEKKYKETVCIDEEIPFDIPNTWEWVRLSDVVQVNPKNDVPDNTLAAFIPMERIDATYLSSFTYSERKWGDIKAGFTHFADGDVAFAKITPCFQNRKSMILKGLPNGVGAGTTELKVLRPYAETIDREYLLFFLESSYFVEEATFKGTANQQRIISGYLETKLFPLPPLSEQHRISEKIKELYSLIGL